MLLLFSDKNVVDFNSSSGEEYVPENNIPEYITDQKQQPEQISESGPTSFSLRKRQRNESNWKKNIRKTKKAKGMSYISATGTVIQQKIFQYIENCCFEKCFTYFDEKQQSRLFNSFYELGSHDTQSAYIFSQIKVDNTALQKQSLLNKTGENVNNKRRKTTNMSIDSKKKFVRQYYLSTIIGDKKVCKTFFKKVLHVSDGRIDRVLKNKDKFTPPKDKRGHHIPHNKTPENKVKQVCDFIETFPSYELHYNRAKSKRKYLSPDLNIATLYRQYKQQIPEPVSSSVFKAIFNSKFNLHFHPPLG